MKWEHLVLMLLVAACDSIDNSQDPTYFRTIGFRFQDAGRGLAISSDGGFLICGFTNSILDNLDMLVIKADGNGAIQWTKTFGGAAADVAAAAVQVFDGNYVIAGRAVTASSRRDLFVLKIGPRGEVIWQKVFGGTGDQEAFALDHTHDGGCIIAGVTINDMYVVKLDMTGLVEWERIIGKKYFEFSRAIRQTVDGRYVVAGHTNSLNREYQPFVMLLDEEGQELWTRLLPANDKTEIFGLDIARDRGFVLVGRIGSSPGPIRTYVAKTNAMGILEWNTILRPTANSVANAVVTDDSAFVLAGSAQQDREHAWMLLAKLGYDGSVLWNRTLGDEGLNQGHAIQVHPDGGYIVVGSTRGVNDDPEQVLLVRVDENGEL